MRSIGILFLSFALLAVSLFACRHYDGSELRQAGAFSAEDFAKLKQFFYTYCNGCHITGNGEEVEGDLRIAQKVTDANQLELAGLVASGLVVAGKPDESRLWQRLAARSMPPTDAPRQPSSEESRIVERWITAGAPLSFGDGSIRNFVSPLRMLRAIAKDLKSLAQEDRKFMRYLSLRNLHNLQVNGVPVHNQTTMAAYRSGLSILVNSLHWRPEITPLGVVDDTDETILRLDLRQYSSSKSDLEDLDLGDITKTDPQRYEALGGVGITAFAWEQLVNNDPYKVTYQNQLSEFMVSETETKFPFMRADIFTFLASRGHDPKKAETAKFQYHKILGIPDAFENLNRALFKNTLADRLRSGASVARYGFPNSGVSDHNRLLERHVIPTYKASVGGPAAYWLSYDFSSSIGAQHLESHPLGPSDAFGNVNGGQNVFKHDGGEVIFSLPNGLHAYILITAAGGILGEGPINIVKDPKRGAILNGISCMDCHRNGMLEKADTMFDHIQANRARYTPEEFNLLSNLYRRSILIPDPKGSSARVDLNFRGDTDTFLKARRAALIPGESYNDATAQAIPDIYDRFVADVTVAAAASEVDMSEGDFKTALEQNDVLQRILAAFNTPSGKIVKRETFREFFPRLVKELRMEELKEPAEGLCDGCVVTCAYQVYSPKGAPLGQSLSASSRTSEAEADQAAFDRCSARLGENIRRSGYVCKKVSACTIQK